MIIVVHEHCGGVVRGGDKTPSHQPIAGTQLPAIKSTTVDLPSGDSLFPGGAAADAINNNCLACHSADMVLNQPALPKATWEAEVHKMINVYRAPIDEADVPAIVD